MTSLRRLPVPPPPVPPRSPVPARDTGSRPGPRGWLGRGRGSSTYVQAPDEWRGTTVQACGLWPFGAGSGSPMIGVPLGRHMLTNATLCCDPLSWFERGQLVLNPSVFVLGLPGLGKSTIVRRMALGLAGFGTMPVILGDLKPDYVDLVQALGGQVIPLGRGRGSLNVLDPGEATAAAARPTGSPRDQVLAEAHGRRHTMVCALLQIIRSQAPTDREETIDLLPALRAYRHLLQVQPVLDHLPGRGFPAGQGLHRRGHRPQRCHPAHRARRQ